MIILLVVVLWIGFCPVGYTAKDIGVLDYPVKKESVSNPWLIKAASGWPSMAPQEIARLAVTPPAKTQKRFFKWIQVIHPKWQPDKAANIPFMEGSGFVHVKEADGYRIRVREIEKPAFPGSEIVIMTRAVAIVVEPGVNPLHLPGTQKELLSILKTFLSPGVGDWLTGKSDDYVRPSKFIKTEEGVFVSVWPKKSTLPGPLYAWTDGEILIIAIYDDAQYGTGPVPKPQIKPTPHPPLGEE